MRDIDGLLRQAMTINGARGASLIDYTTGLPVDTVGAVPGNSPEATAAGTAELMHAMLDTAAFASAPGGDDLEDIVVTAASGYHVFHCLPVRFDSRLVLHLWLDRETGNIALTRRRLRLLIEELVG
ncbi:hypothetical protein AB0M43_14930 [Longispora sp. NPDC051575]|uniref:hypothetical protein n=1 Tax=Longispora sp. NPDC051575 TaxID=3154943 RepID=UPI00342702D1